MKSLLIFSVINLLLLPFIDGQKWAPLGAKWYYNQPSSESHNYVSFESVKDTMIQEKSVRVIEIKVNGSIFISREFISENKDSVFYFNTNSNTFHLLYNFAANVGDTIIVHQYKFKPTKGFFQKDSIPSFKYRIISIDSIQILDRWYKRQIVDKVRDSEWNFGGTNEFPIIENVGSLVYFFGKIIYAYPEQQPTILRCYNDVEISYQNQTWTQNCDFLPTEISQNLINDFEVYPNPFSGSLNINFNDHTGFVEVYDLRGLKVYSSDQKSRLFNIDLSHLVNGIYFVIIKTDSKIYFKKIVKQSIL